MKRFLLSFLAIVFPWAVFLLEGMLGLAVLAIALQASFIGWIPISVVAWQHRNNFKLTSKKSKQPEQSE